MQTTVASPAHALVSIGSVAKRCSVTPETVRDWERRGLIPPALRLEGNERRVWTSEEVAAIVAARRRDVPAA